jgi:hypothetical protein
VFLWVQACLGHPNQPCPFSLGKPRCTHPGETQ